MFKVKNLMIDVVGYKPAPGTLCYFPSDDCYPLSLDCRFKTHIFCGNFRTVINCLPFSLDCVITHDGCGANYSTCFRTDIFVLDTKQLVINPADVAVVREQLNELLDAVLVRAEQVNTNMAVTDMAQADVLEQELEAALKAIRAQKKQLGG